MFAIKNLRNGDFVCDNQGYRYLFDNYRSADQVARKWNKVEDNGNLFVTHKVMPTIGEIFHYDALDVGLI